MQGSMHGLRQNLRAIARQQNLVLHLWEGCFLPCHLDKLPVDRWQLLPIATFSHPKDGKKQWISEIACINYCLCDEFPDFSGFSEVLDGF
jgi:hypothetical protein